ncbi:MAG: DUF2225 domain-containing protein [Roseburia sp.]|nr:DUF2225 domain-containing protein [Roseburia sp.]
MANIFAGLESLGLKVSKNIEVYEEEKKEVKGSGEGENKPKELSEEDLLFDKSYTCPVCDKEFKSKMVRTGKAKLVSADTDLRPKYHEIDPLKYDAVLCPNCGYASLNRYFNFVMGSQAKIIKEQISKTFEYKSEDEKIYSYDEAIMRHKMALLNTVVKKGKTSERAYTCLKLAWLFRGKREEMLQGEYKQEEVDELLKEEVEFLENAHEGFVSAFSKEGFPMCGMDQHTVIYLVAELARRIGQTDEAKRWVSKVLVARDANKRIKDKALALKELLQEEGAD